MTTPLSSCCGAPMNVEGLEEIKEWWRANPKFTDGIDYWDIPAIIAEAQRREREEIRGMVAKKWKTENAYRDESVGDTQFFAQLENIGWNTALDVVLRLIDERGKSDPRISKI